MQTQPTHRREDQPDGSAKIWFAAPILDIDKPKRFLILRQPRAGEIWDLGDPRSYIYNADGLGTPYVDRERLKKWIDRLMTEHDADVIGVMGDAALGMLIEETVLDFFTNARTQSKTASAPSLQPA